MFRIPLFAAILVTLLSPVSAQQLAEPLAFNLDVTGGQVLAGFQQNDSTCVIGNGGGTSLTYPANNADFLRSASAATLPQSDLTVAHSFSSSWSDAELPLLALPDARASGYRHPRSLAWLADSEVLFGVQGSAHAMTFEVPLLFPGLSQRENRPGSVTGGHEYQTATDFYSRHHRHATETATRSNRVGFVTASAPLSVVPAGMQDAMAGLHRLWNCVGSSPPQPEVQQQQQQQAQTTTVKKQAATALTFSGQVNQLANNLGGLGRIYRADHSSGPALVVNRLVSASEEKLAFWVTQAEVNAAGVGCFKASADDRIAATKQGNGNIVIAMGPDYENKTFHVIFDGGLGGGVGGTVTTYDGAPGANCQ